MSSPFRPEEGKEHFGVKQQPSAPPPRSGDGALCLMIRLRESILEYPSQRRKKNEPQSERDYKSGRKFGAVFGTIEKKGTKPVFLGTQMSGAIDNHV